MLQNRKILEIKRGFTRKLVHFLKNRVYIDATIQISLKIHKNKNKQVLYIADYIRKDVLTEIDVRLKKVISAKTEDVDAFQLGMYISRIGYNLEDYSPAAKELIRLYKVNQKLN